MKGWDEIPGKEMSQPYNPNTKSDWAVTPKTHLKQNTLTQLVSEVHRLQTLVREIAIEYGLERRSKTSEHYSPIHFVSNTIDLLRSNINL